MKRLGAGKTVALLATSALTIPLGGCGSSALCGRLKARAITFGQQQASQFQGIAPASQMQTAARQDATAYLHLEDVQHRVSCSL